MAVATHRGSAMAVVVVLLAFLTVGLLAYLGTFAPWSPHMDAWSGAELAITYVDERAEIDVRAVSNGVRNVSGGVHHIDGGHSITG